MPYTNAVYYMDYVNGSDSTRATLTDVVFSNPTGNIVSGYYVSHGLVTGAIITVSGCTQTYANSQWKVTVDEPDNFELDNALWGSFTGADVTGDVVPFGGQSWDDAWKTITLGATAARIAPGDTIRMAKSPDPVSLGVTGTWTSGTVAGGALPTAIAITSSTGDTPIVITKAAHGLTDGKVVQVLNHTVNTAANGQWVVANKTNDTFELQGSVGNGTGGATGTFQDVSSRCVVLSSSLNTTIDTCDISWTAGTNVTSANATASYNKQGLYFLTIITASGHAGAGIIAKKALPVSIDLNSPDNHMISFWLKSSSGIADGDLLIKLYSDANCTSEVESFAVPACIVSNYSWMPVTVDKGSNLSATVQGIAVYATKALPSKTYCFDNFIACKNPSLEGSLSLTSLIGRAATATNSAEGWYAIQSIEGKIVVLDGIALTAPFAQGAYYEASGDTTIYKREPINTAITSGVAQAIQDSGTAGSLISFNGGYNTSGPDTQDGETIFSGQCGTGDGINFNSKSYISMDNIGAVKYEVGIYVYSSNYSSIGFIPIASNCGWGVYMYASTGIATGTIRCANYNGSSSILIQGGSDNSIITIGNVNSNFNYGLQNYSSARLRISSIANMCGNAYNYILPGSASPTIIGLVTNCSYNGYNGIQLNTYPVIIGSITANYNSGYGILFTSAANNCYIYGGSTTGNTSGGVSTTTGNNYIHNFTINESTKVSGPTAGNDSYLFIEKYGGTAGVNMIFSDGGTIESQTATKYEATGIAWKFSPGSTRTIYYPLILDIARILCAADKEVTVQAYMKKDHATNVGCKLYIPGYQLSGMTDMSYEAVKTNDTNWELLEVKFTPTEVGVVKVEAHSWYNTGVSCAYIDLMIITQAA